MKENITLNNLETKRLVLRKLTLKDAQDILDYVKDPETAKNVFWNSNQTLEDITNFIKETKTNYMWGIQLKNENKIIGTCGFIHYFQETKCFRIGYALNKNYWNKGYMKEALITIINYTFNNLDAIRIEGICTEDNIASQKTMLSCNMIFEGILHDNFIKDNKIKNCKIFAVTKRNYFNNN